MKLRWLPKAPVIVFYVVLLCFGIARHEWGPTEAQLWLLARDASLSELLFHRMRYEGNPGLLHLILLPAAKLGAPYYAVNILGGAVAIGTAAIILFASPFSVWLAAVLPFTFFLSFQYAVVARPYGLLGFVLLLLASLHRERYERRLAYFCLLSALTLTSVHGAFLAVVLFLSLFSGLRTEIPKFEARARRELFLCAVGYVLLLGLVGLELWPAKDAALSHPSYETFNFDYLNFFRTAMEALNGALTGNGLLSALSMAGILFFVYLGGCAWLTLSLLGALLLLFGVKGLQAWHLGIIQFVFLFGAWLAWERAQAASKFARALVAIAVLPCVVLNLDWALAAYKYDRASLFGGGQEIAAYIKKNSLQDARIYAYGRGVVNIQPYFPRNIFANIGSGVTYNLWQKDSPYQQPVPDRIPPDADVVIVGNFYPVSIPDPLQEFPQLKGWQLQRKLIVPMYENGVRLLFETYFVFTRRKATGEPVRPMISAVIDVPGRLRSRIISGTGYLVALLVDAKNRSRPPLFRTRLFAAPVFPFRISIEQEELRAQLNRPDAVSKVKALPVSFRAFYCTNGHGCSPVESFAYLRQELTWNRPWGAELGTLFFQGYNSERTECPPGKDPLLAGSIRLDPEVERRFPTKKFLLAVVASGSDGAWDTYSYTLVHTQALDLGETNRFLVPRRQAKLPANGIGRFLLYLLDLRNCSPADTAHCAATLIEHRDDDMSHVIPLTAETLLAPICGQTNLKMVGFYEPDWATIPIPASLLR